MEYHKLLSNIYDCENVQWKPNYNTMAVWTGFFLSYMSEFDSALEIHQAETALNQFAAVNNIGTKHTSSIYE